MSLSELNKKFGNKSEIYQGLVAKNGGNLFLPKLTSPACT